MRSANTIRTSAFSCGLLALVASLAGGCVNSQRIPNHFREDITRFEPADLDTPTSTAIRENYEPAEPRHRGWEPTTIASKDGTVYHWPLYFEDPFEDKGHGRTERTHPWDVYRVGWESVVAAPYGLARFTVNWMFLPVSAVVTPPWTMMESDGVLSKQALGNDHDATPARDSDPTPPPAAEPEPDEESV